MRMETLTLPSATILDKQALAGIYKQHSTELFRYAYKLLGDNDLAEDCVAETFSRLLHAVHRNMGPHENVRAWLYRVAHNWITDHYRRQPLLPLDLEVDLQANQAENPSQVVGNNLDQEHVRAALLRLPPEQRQVIELRFLEGWAHEEVANALGKSTESTRALQYRALNSLRRMLLETEK
jgi:RNA polymerase sigma-70 factor (ECF subfamily)